jgi:hypothetical protein
MALNFPSSPTNGDTFEGYVYSSSTGTWDYAVTSTTAPSEPLSPFLLMGG